MTCNPFSLGDEPLVSVKIELELLALFCKVIDVKLIVLTSIGSSKRIVRVLMFTLTARLVAFGAV